MWAIQRRIGIQPAPHSRVLGPVHSRQHKLFFMPSGFHSPNILISRGRLSGIVDWGCAGY
ncbi:hypothetical protein BDV12DRAFT_164385 [Aspergillus spectabilis]